MSGVTMDLKCDCGCGQHITMCRKKTQRKLSVLIVDDDPHMRELLADMMLKFGHEVDVVDSGEKALKFVKSFRIYDGYDAFVRLVFTDFRMPSMDGIELTKSIKDYDPRVRIVLMSGDDPDAIGKAALAAGADAFIKKPFSIEELRATITNVFP